MAKPEKTDFEKELARIGAAYEAASEIREPQSSDWLRNLCEIILEAGVHSLQSLEQTGAPVRTHNLISTNTANWREAYEAFAALGVADIVLLYGQPGTGKTTGVAGALFLQLFYDWSPRPSGYVTNVRWIDATDYCYTEPWGTMRKEFINAKFLVIDDAGLEPKDRAHHLESLICKRYGNAMPTLITSNLSPKQFCDRYGERVADRLRHAGKSIAFKERRRPQK